MTLHLPRLRWIFLLGITLGFVILPTGRVFAQRAFPSRPIQFVVPLAPGGIADVHARALAPVLERILKQPVEVIYKPGAVSKVGIQYVTTKPPDGYTLLLAMPSFFSIPEVDRLLGRPLAFTREQFTPLARLSADPGIIFTSTAGPWKSFAELVADAKRRPGEIKYSSTGMYSSPHEFAVRTSIAAGIKLLHIPMEGGAPALTALLGGHVDLNITTETIGLPHVRAGTLRRLAVLSSSRIADIPEVPTLKDLGYDVEGYYPVLVVVRKDIPPTEIRILSDALREAVDDPQFKSAMAKIGTPIAYLGGEDLKQFWKWQTEATIATYKLFLKEK